MRRLLESIANRITQFVAQRDDLVLVIQTSGETAPAFLQVLAPIGDSSEAGLFFTFDDAFVDPASYVETVVGSFRTWLGGMRSVMIKEKMPPWPDLPASLARGGMSPLERLRELMIFSRSLLPQPDTQVVVWTFMPKEVADCSTFAVFVRDLLAHRIPVPWCHHMRVLVRDDPATGPIRRLMVSAPRVQWYQPPLGPDAYQQGIEDDFADPTLSLPERMTALLVSATTDFSYGRHEQALEKYLLLINYHSARNEKVQTALAWNGVGEVQAKAGDAAGAGRSFEAAMAIATDVPYPSAAVMFTIAWNLARLRMDQQRYGEAASYFDVAQHSAACMRSAELKLMAMEWHGVARQANREAAVSVELWEAGANVAEGLKMLEPRNAMLTRLRDHFASNPIKVGELQRRLAKPIEQSIQN